MKREIKFRAWNSDTKTMIDLYEITPLALSKDMNTQLALQGMSGLFIPFSGKLDIMQFTGVKDKNGKEIYEGDHIRWYIDSQYGKEEFTEIVFYIEGAFYPICNVRGYEFEVIGNIYERILKEFL
jgi:uncharacterized phage protein (TIGR01671 family)